MMNIGYYVKLQEMLVQLFTVASLCLLGIKMSYAEGYRYEVKGDMSLVPFKIGEKQFYADVRVTTVSSNIDFLLVIVYNRKPKLVRTLFDNQSIAYFQPGIDSYYPEGDKKKKKRPYLDQDIEYCSDSNDQIPCDIPEFRQVLIKRHSDRATLSVKNGLLKIVTEKFGSTVIGTKPTTHYYFWKWSGVKFIEQQKLRKKFVGSINKQ